MGTDACIKVEVDGIMFTSAYRYYDGDSQEVCHSIKEDQDMLDHAARRMAQLIPRNGTCIVPVPNRCGYARQTYDLAKAISKYCHMPVADVLVGKERESNYYCKKDGHPLSENDMAFRQIEPLPFGRRPVIIDGVADHGTTAKAAYHALGDRGEVVTYAVSDNLLAQGKQIQQCRGIHR